MAEINLFGWASGANSGLSSIFLMTVVIVEIILILGIVGVFLYVFAPTFLWNIKIIKFGYRNGVLKYLGKTYGKIEVNDGVERFRVWTGVLDFIKKRRIYIEPVPNEYKLALSKKKDMVILFEDNAGNLRPLQIALDSSDESQQHIFLPADKDVDYWSVLERQKSFNAYHKQSTFHQWVPIVASATFLIFIFVFMLVLNKQIGGIVEQVSKLTDNLGRLVDMLTAALPK